MRACLPVLKRILEGVKDNQGIPLGLERFLSAQGLQETDRNLTLDEAAVARLALFFRLQSKVKDIDRIELIGRRIAMLSHEEAVYWLANVTTADPALRSWAVSGLRLMLCGDSGDKRLARVLERMRARGLRFLYRHLSILRSWRFMRQDLNGTKGTGRNAASMDSSARKSRHCSTRRQTCTRTPLTRSKDAGSSPSVAENRVDRRLSCSRYAQHRLVR